MAQRRGLQSDVLVSLSAVMVMATAVVGAVIVKAHEAHIRQIELIAARTLIADASTPLSSTWESVPGIRWWLVDADGRAIPRGHHSEELGEEGLAFAGEAWEQGASLLRAGPPWQPMLFAARVSAGEVAVARLPAAVSPLWIAGLLIAVAAIFTGFGSFLLRRRLVLPLQRAAAVARSIADGESGPRVPVEGLAETAELAVAFNDMTDALEGRTLALEKAVVELRESNASLRTARAGLARAERLAAVGRLAAGVAHEVGNPMGALLAFMDLAGREPGVPEKSRALLERAGREGGRVRDILRQLLDFSRPPRTRLQPVDLLRVCEETADLVRAQRRYARVSLEVRAEAGAAAAWADPSGVAQIVLNLLLNAADALEEHAGKPSIEVVVRAVARGGRAGDGALAASGRSVADCVECWIRDNGPGIAEEDRERIFDPFFTTKEPGKGTGLGLSNAARFAEELGGSLELDTKAGPPGAAFVLRLPAATAREADAAVREDC